MKLNSEQTVICNVFSRRDKTGHVHCHDCPMELHSRDCICLKNVTKEHAVKDYDWNGSPYPALGEYEGEKDGTD